MTNSTLLSQTPARRMQGCIGEYERIKHRESTAFKTVRDFCLYHKFSHRNFMKIYRRCRQNPSPGSPVPQRREPVYCTRRVGLQTEEHIVNLRRQGNNRCEIRDILRENAASVPGPTTHLQHLQAAWTEQITPGSKTGMEKNYYEQNRAHPIINREQIYYSVLNFLSLFHD